ncbi:uncharacterized protein LOC118478837 [Aplysia californica]|uniref:Uncharacterized protein LOC118478837 n=1 Tax=Aplysia californica TaxID=6500 RepID=A0ABM1W2Z5_APLCA|nr:uncharacterized protein LOC118478837 [Aplysia californica]
MTSSVCVPDTIESLTRLDHLYPQPQSSHRCVLKPRPIRLASVQQLWVTRDAQVQGRHSLYTKPHFERDVSGGCFHIQPFQNEYYGLRDSAEISRQYCRELAVDRNLVPSEGIDNISPAAQKLQEHIAPHRAPTVTSARGHLHRSGHPYETLRSCHQSKIPSKSSLLGDLIRPYSGGLHTPRPITKVGFWGNSLGLSRMSRDARKSFYCAQRLKQKALQQKKKHFLTPVSKNRPGRFGFRTTNVYAYNALSEKIRSPNDISFDVEDSRLKSRDNVSEDGTWGSSAALDKMDSTQLETRAQSEKHGTENAASDKREYNNTSLSNLENESLVRLPYRFHDQQHRSLSSENKKTFRCPQCRYVTDRKNNLKRHIVTMHQESTKLLECCGVGFQSKAALRDHNAIFHRGGYRCQICSRNFCRKALLRRHLTVHSGQKDFFCELCGYATSHKSNLERHQKVHSKRADFIEKKENIAVKPTRDAEGNIDASLKETRQRMLESPDELFPPLHAGISDPEAIVRPTRMGIDDVESCIQGNSLLRKRQRKRLQCSKKFLLPRRLRETYVDNTENTRSRSIGEPPCTPSQFNEPPCTLSQCNDSTCTHSQCNEPPCTPSQCIDPTCTPSQCNEPRCHHNRCAEPPYAISECGEAPSPHSPYADPHCLVSKCPEDKTPDEQFSKHDTSTVGETTTQSVLSCLKRRQSGSERRRRETDQSTNEDASWIPHNTITQNNHTNNEEMDDNPRRFDKRQHSLTTPLPDQSARGDVTTGPVDNLQYLTSPRQRLFSVVYSCPDCLHVYLSQRQLGSHLCRHQVADPSLRVPVVTSVLRGRLGVVNYAVM